MPDPSMQGQVGGVKLGPLCPNPGMLGLGGAGGAWGGGDGAGLLGMSPVVQGREGVVPDPQPDLAALCHPSGL